MTKENKDLLLKDLCGRLHYVTYIRIVEPDCFDKSESVTEGCIGGYSNTRMCQDYSMDEIFEFIESGDMVKPFLRPMSSMTMEEKDYYDTITFTENEHFIGVLCGGVVDWLNAHHFDYRGLIEKGLAIEAPEGMYDN